MSTVQALIVAIDSIYPNAESDTSKVSYMNMAQNDLSNYFGTVVEDSTLTTIVDDDSYAFPSGLADISEIITLDIGQVATPTTRHNYTRYYQGNRDEIPIGSRCYFQIVSSTGVKSLGIYPIPNTVSLPIRIRYNKKLTDLSATTLTQVPDFDSRYHDLLVWFAIHMICASGTSPDSLQSDFYMQKYENGVNSLWKLRMNQGRLQRNRRNDNSLWRNR